MGCMLCLSDILLVDPLQRLLPADEGECPGCIQAPSPKPTAASTYCCVTVSNDNCYRVLKSAPLHD